VKLQELIYLGKQTVRSVQIQRKRGSLCFSFRVFVTLIEHKRLIEQSAVLMENTQIWKGSLEFSCLCVRSDPLV